MCGKIRKKENLIGVFIGTKYELVNIISCKCFLVTSHDDLAEEAALKKIIKNICKGITR